jgi:hypothetical protein
MKKIKVLWFFALLFAVISCNKDENPTNSYADKVVGTYHGTMYHGAAPLICTSQIIKTADAKVTLTLIIGGSSFTFGGEIAVMNGGNNTYNLSYSDQGGYLNGKVEGNALTFSVNQGVLNDVFTGSR